MSLFSTTSSYIFTAFFEITWGRQYGKSRKVLFQTQYPSSLNNSVPAIFSKKFPEPCFDLIAFLPLVSHSIFKTHFSSNIHFEVLWKCHFKGECYLAEYLYFYTKSLKSFINLTTENRGQK